MIDCSKAVGDGVFDAPSPTGVLGSLCYWRDRLVMPAYNNITSAFGYLEKVKSDPEAESNPTFNELIVETEGLKKVAMEIMNIIGYYNLPC